MSAGVFVTGTDTGVGKTLTASALVAAFAGRGQRVAGMKPVVSGAVSGAAGPEWEDVAALRAVASVEAPLDLISPYRFLPAVAPHIAAAEAGVAIEPAVILSAYAALAERAERVVVEGVGGFRVPLGPGFDTADLAVALGLPVVLVVGMRLGCINHALLTSEALARRGLRLAGWVANRVDPAMARFDENLDALRTCLDVPLLGVFPFRPAPSVTEYAGILDLAPLGMT